MLSLLRVLRQIALAAVLIAGASLASADSWFAHARTNEHVYAFGSTRIILTEKNPGGYNAMSQWIVSVREGGKLVAEHNGLSFNQLFVSSTTNYFTGVSNTALTRYAWVVFDRRGNIKAYRMHHDESLKYCGGTATLHTPWFDAKTPNVEFVEDASDLKDVRINGCDGQRLSLLTEPQPAKEPKQP